MTSRSLMATKKGGILKNSAILIFIYSLFSFKYEIIGDVRIDDLLAVVLVLVSIIFFKNKYKTWRQIKNHKITQSILLFIIINIISTVYNAWSGHIGIFQGVLYSLRHLEYFLYLYLGYILSYYGYEWIQVFQKYLIYILLLIPLQFYGFFPVFSGFTPDRAMANTGGPWELAVVSGFLVLYFHREKQRLLALISFLVLIFTGSRITLFAVVFIFIYKYIILRDAGKLKAVLALMSFTLILLMALLLNNTYEWTLFNRFGLFFSNETFLVLESFFDNSLIVNKSSEFADLNQSDKLNFDLSTANGDQSAFVRFSNWIILIKSLIAIPGSTFLGLGPSFAGKAVDGAYVRLFVEVGLLGILSYGYFILSVFRAKLGSLLSEYFCIILISACFIDVITTYKIMFIFWVVVGASLQKEFSGQKGFK
jgi:hypothetical protein